MQPLPFDRLCAAWSALTQTPEPGPRTAAPPLRDFARNMVGRRICCACCWSVLLMQLKCCP